MTLPRPTIAAIATGSAPGAIGIIRISGAATAAVVDAVFRRRDWPGYAAVPQHTLHLGRISGPDTIPLDFVLLLVMRAPQSFTGEDVAEFHCHGGPAALTAVLQAVQAAGALPAPPGEFTRRAFLAGKLDLTQAEAVAALVGARSRAALALAAAQHDGLWARWLRDLRLLLDEFLAAVTYALDIDEGEAPFAAHDWQPRLAAAAAALAAARQRGERNLRSLTGVSIALTGPPNAGKSSLFNRLLNEERAIVTPLPGTTRDPVRGDMVLNGMTVTLIDTAGWCDKRDLRELAAERRRQASVAAAAVTLVVLDGSVPPPADLAARRQSLADAGCLWVLNKCDLPAAWPAAAAAAGGIAARVSATTGAGIGELLNLIAAQVQADALEPELPGAITDRQQEAVARAAAALAALQAALAATAGVECLLVEAKAVAAALDELTGRTTSDDILHAVFSRFCVGK